jgi:hypothetical protein
VGEFLLYSLDRLLDGDRPYSKMSHKRAIVRENDKERRRYSDGINAQGADLQTNLRQIIWLWAPGRSD